jgi:hypothetical protein
VGALVFLGVFRVTLSAMSQYLLDCKTVTTNKFLGVTWRKMEMTVGRNTGMEELTWSARRSGDGPKDEGAVSRPRLD